MEFDIKVSSNVLCDPLPEHEKTDMGLLRYKEMQQLLSADQDADSDGSIKIRR
jgi:hypothetical protein